MVKVSVTRQEEEYVLPPKEEPHYLLVAFWACAVRLVEMYEESEHDGGAVRDAFAEIFNMHLSDAQANPSYDEMRLEIQQVMHNHDLGKPRPASARAPKVRQIK